LLIIGTNLLSKIIQAGIFAFGLIMAVKGMLSPKMTGIIVTVFFVTVCMTDTCQILGNPSLEYGIAIMFIIVPGLAGAFASYKYFCRAETAKIWPVLIFAASFWGISRTITAAFILAKYADQVISMYTAMNITINISVCLLFIYQTYTLKRKRHIALEVSQPGN